MSFTLSPDAAERVGADLWALGAVGIEETGEGLRAAFTDADAAQRAAARFPADARIEIVDDTFGLDGHRAHLRAMRAGRFVVHPPWIVPADDAIPLSIDPGHAFGSGSHPSTRLALELLGREDLEAAAVVDIGCGSGVLSIAAARLGATVLAVDPDPAAVAATRTNAAANAVADRVTTRQGSIEVMIDGATPDLMLVNVTIDIHEALARRAAFVPGRTIAAGVLRGEQARRCAQSWGLHTEVALAEEEWAGLLLAP